jgi:hypothetical protein
MLLLFDIYTDHNANVSPAPWLGSNFSMSEGEMIQENQLVLIKFCLKPECGYGMKILWHQQKEKLTTGMAGWGM